MIMKYSKCFALSETNSIILNDPILWRKYLIIKHICQCQLVGICLFCKWSYQKLPASLFSSPFNVFSSMENKYFYIKKLN